MRTPTALLRSMMLLALLVAGCGDVLPPRGSCTISSASSCTDYTGTAWSAPSSGQRACTQVGMGAVYSTNTCATASRVGSCRLQAGTASEVVVRYYGPRLDANTARAACMATAADAQFTPN